MTILRLVTGSYRPMQQEAEDRSQQQWSEKPDSQPAKSMSSKPQRRFQFIDNNDVTSMNASSTQVRRHVMQEYMREKRWKSRSRKDGDLEPEGPSKRKSASKARPYNRVGPKHSRATAADWSLSPTSIEDSSNGGLPQSGLHRTQTDPDIVEEIPRFDTGTIDSSSSSTVSFRLSPMAFAQIADMFSTASTSSPTVKTTSDVIFSPQRSERSVVSASSASPQPQSFLSAARTDPFNALPMALSKKDQELFDFYANVMPACSYGFERRSPHAHNWYLSVFIPEAMKGAVCFQNTILAHAANTQAWIQGLPETPLAIEHRARASEMLLKHFQKHPFDTSDAAISATLSAAALEDFDPRVERREYAWIHWKAAVQKIRDRGGPEALVQNNRLQALINWSDYIFSGYNAYGGSFFFDHVSSASLSDDIEATYVASMEISQQCTEFITFLKCAEHLALVQANMQNNPIVRSQQTLRYSVFQPGQPLFKLVAGPNSPRYTKTGQFKQLISRIATLMTINTAIWEYRHSTELCEEFFSELLENIKYNELDKHLSVEALLQILLSGSQLPGLVHTERPWFVGRMLKVAKRLSRPAFEKLNELLLRFLTLGPNLEPYMSDWENELRMEILQAPLVSYTLPFMR